MGKFLKKRRIDMLIGIFLLLVIIPQSRKPIQVFLQRLVAVSPQINSQKEALILQDYDLNFSNQTGHHFSLKEAQGKVIVINFWATWCPPCIAEMPMFQNLYQDYKNEVKFYFITQDDWSMIQSFQVKRKLDLPIYTLQKPSNQLDYTSLPTTYVINKQGKVLIEKVGVADWDSSAVRALLDEALKE